MQRTIDDSNAEHVPRALCQHGMYPEASGVSRQVIVGILLALGGWKRCNVSLSLCLSPGWLEEVQCFSLLL